MMNSRPIGKALEWEGGGVRNCVNVTGVIRYTNPFQLLSSIVVFIVRLHFDRKPSALQLSSHETEV